MEKIKDIVAQMPQESQQVDTIIEQVATTKNKDQEDLETIAADFKDMPVFEPVDQTSDKNKSLNDKLKSSALKIGLNDRIAFIKHLFNDNANDYDKALTQLNASTSFKEASNYITSIIKPEYNNWEGKEEYEERLFEIIENKFN